MRSERKPRTWWPEAALLLALAGLTWAVAAGAFLGGDVALRDWCDGHRPLLLYWPARGLNELGQGGFFTGVAAALALFLAWRRRSVRPLLPVILAFVLTFGTLTPLKHWTDRAAPHTWTVPHPERFGSGGVSYPSGHLANALVWYGVLALLLSPWLKPLWRKVIRIAPPAILFVTTVYLGYHWLTDTVAGLLLGLLLDRLMRRVDFDRIRLPRAVDRGRLDPAAAAHDPEHV